MVGLQVIYLLLEEQCPEVFAEEFYRAEGICRAGRGAREATCALLARCGVLSEPSCAPFYDAEAYAVSQRLQSVEHRFPRFLFVHGAGPAAAASAAAHPNGAPCVGIVV